MPAIEVSHLTKEYRLGALQGLKQTLLNTGARLAGRKVLERPLFKALDDVSFSIEPGEVVGIIGHNGAGKSTLLKMLARISTPTRGSVKVNGRIAPLIEVGAGFVPDFTGRENVYLNGSILGMSKKEIDKKFDEIVDFAEMAEFIDTPVKRYSSGMQVKLAFAVATSIESEILIVDEVLAVGDLAFQRKCFDRMEHLIKREQRTVLLVSHNIRQIERLCKRVMLLDHGKIAASGGSKEICNIYYEQNDKKIAEQLRGSAEKVRDRFTTSGEIELIDICIRDKSGLAVSSVEHGKEAVVELRFNVRKPIRNVIFGLGIHTTDFLYLADKDTEDDHLLFEAFDPGEISVRCRIRSFPLLPGTFVFRVGVAVGPVYRIALYGEGLHPFQVVGKYSTRPQGFIPLMIDWQAEQSTAIMSDTITPQCCVI